jgi:uncharacterized repeat protein (TIGR01451 family)
MSQPRSTRRSRLLAVMAAFLLLPISMVGGASAGPPTDDSMMYKPGTRQLEIDEEQEQELLERDLEYIQNRLAGDRPLTISEAGALRSQAAKAAKRLRELGGTPPSGPVTMDGPWADLGPNPIVQGLRSPDPEGQRFGAMSGRIGALAIRPSNGQIILGGAQGGIWLFDWDNGSWTAKTDDLPSLAIGALAIAPSNDAIVYAGTGEGAFSGDSYFGNGILKSTDGGETWAHVSGDYFIGVSSSALVVDPTNADHLYVSVMRGRGGNHRTSPALHSKFGVWESKDGGVSWTLIFEQKATLGATDLEIDPQDANILFASFLGDKVYKSTDGGRHWATAMNGLPDANYAEQPTRFQIEISHPEGQDAVMYLGFAEEEEPSHVWRSDDLGGTWTQLPDGTGDIDNVEDYCAEQCTYDNVVEADPNNSDVVFAAGQFGYDIGSGGIFRSDDGGQTWKNLGWDQHPDYHALAFNSSNPGEVVQGSDGGVWWSADLGGRPNLSDPLDAVTWVSLNGGVDPYTSAVQYRTGLQIGQFTSIAIVPQVAGRYWGGTQDNGTMRKSTASQSWFDMANGDGGQVLVDPTPDTCAFGANTSCVVYGTYFGISPWRVDDGGAFFFSNQYIRNGINLNDRSEFYVPFTMNKLNPNQLLLGTYRLYRTDNARTEKAGDVKWKAISPDLTSGCPGTAPNGARGCLIGAIGVGGGNAVYVGTDDGLLWIAQDGLTSSSPNWVRLDQNGLPKRPVAEIKVDPSNYRVAYVAYNGFNPATPGTPGHLFKTTDAGAHWVNISGNLPDSPLNTVIVDPSFPNTLYAGTDVGPYVSYDGGFHWSWLGEDFPIVGIWQMDFDPARRVLVAGTHGRGAFRITDENAYPAMVVSKIDAGIPVGAGSSLDYTITVRNMGGADATGVTVTDTLPANTSFVSAGDGGTFSAGKVRWTGLTIAAGSSVDLHFRVSIASALKKKIAAITNDGITVTTAEGPGATGSPTTTPIAAPYAVSVSPANASGAARAGDSVSYQFTIKNLGSNTDSYNLSASGTFAASIFQSDCTTPATSTSSLAPGSTTDVCVTITVPGDAANGATDTTTFSATSVGSPAVSASSSISTTAVTLDTLLVDEDGNAPDVSAVYAAALTANGIEFGTWDLDANSTLPVGLLEAYTNVVWFTGNTYPGPILPYETQLAAFLDGGGRLFLNGQDLLDQAAGTTAFVHDYLHIDWDGTETQNDKATDTVTGVTGNAVTDGIGTIAIDHDVLGAAFEDKITPIGPATGAFTDDDGDFDALNVSVDGYKVVFLAFPFEAYGETADKTDLMDRVFDFFAAP